MATKKTNGKSDKVEEQQGFEKSLARLEAIVEEMEDRKLSLEDMIARFEEGQKLLKFCAQKLNEVEKKIEVLVKKGDQVVKEEFDPEAGANSDGAEGKDAPF